MDTFSPMKILLGFYFSMVSLAFVSFIAGVLTILAPCVLPVLPVILAGSLTEKERWYPYLVTLSLALSIVIFTVLLKASTAFIDIPSSFWSWLSWGILIFLGLVYLFPHAWARLAWLLQFSKSNTSLDKAQDIGNPLLRAIVTGSVLGPVFSTCSPTYSLLLATVFPVSLISWVIYTLIYALWLSLMLMIVAIWGRSITAKFRGVASETGWFKRTLGVLFILVGVAIVTGFDKKVETAALERFDLSSIEQGIIERFVPQVEHTSTKKTSESPIKKTLVETWVMIKNDTKIPQNDNQKESPTLSVKVPYPAPEIPASLTEWINSNPLTMKSLKWKVVIIDFWTYSCINCQRTLPYLTSWDQKYRDKGLVIIGVHAPEFAFEKIRKNVEKATLSANIAYPIVLDNGFDLWNAYENRYWPAKYFIDREGNVRHTHFGEGWYEESEKVIQYLLGVDGGPSVEPLVSKVPSLEQSPETYLGTGRRANYKSFPAELELNQWMLTPEYIWAKTDPNGKYAKFSDSWKEDADSITAKKSGAGLTFHYKAKDIYLVLGGTGTLGVSTSSKEWWNLGGDVKNGLLTIDGDRMYHLVHANESEEWLLFLDFSAWVQAYAFTFWS